MAHEILVPPLGQTTDTVILATWYRNAGDLVKQGEPLYAIETDKATLDIEAQVSGILAKVSAQAGDEVAVLSTIGTILLEGEKPVAPVAPEDTLKFKSEIPATDASVLPAGNGVVLSHLVTPRQPGQRVFISPRAKRLAETSGIEWQMLSGTGPEGAVVERDVRKSLAHAASTLIPPVIATRHGLETTAPQPIQTHGDTVSSSTAVQLAAEVDISALVTLCERFGNRGLKITVADIAAHIAVKAMGRQDVFPAYSFGVLVTGKGGYHTVVLEGAATRSLLALSRDIAMKVTDAGTRGSTSDRPPSPEVVFADLGRLGIDTASGFGGATITTMISIGRVRQLGDGSQSTWVTLRYMQGAMSDFLATTYFGEVVRMIEDPDMLF